MFALPPLRAMTLILHICTVVSQLLWPLAALLLWLLQWLLLWLLASLLLWLLKWLLLWLLLCFLSARNRLNILLKWTRRWERLDESGYVGSRQIVTAMCRIVSVQARPSVQARQHRINWSEAIGGKQGRLQQAPNKGDSSRRAPLTAFLEYLHIWNAHSGQGNHKGLHRVWNARITNLEGVQVRAKRPNMDRPIVENGHVVAGIACSVELGRSRSTAAPVVVAVARSKASRAPVHNALPHSG